MSERENIQATPEHPGPAERPRAERGADDRRGEVRPKDDPAPSSPAADHEEVEKGERILGRVKPY